MDDQINELGQRIAAVTVEYDKEVALSAFIIQLGYSACLMGVAREELLRAIGAQYDMVADHLSKGPKN